MNQIGHLIKEALKEIEWSNYRLSKVTGIFKNNLTIILGEKGNPEWSTVQKILDAIGYEVVLIKKKGGRQTLLRKSNRGEVIKMG